MAKKKVGGRGRKTCPKCGASVGVRTAQCACKHVFEIKGKGGSKTSTIKQSRLKDALIAEKQKIEEILKDRKRMEQQLTAINEVLKTLE